jgi:hypothetical protein
MARILQEEEDAVTASMLARILQEDEDAVAASVLEAREIEEESMRECGHGTR